MTAIRLQGSTPSFLLSPSILLLLLAAMMVVIVVGYPIITPAYATSTLQTNSGWSLDSQVLPLSLVSGAIIGISLGLIGGGGSILAVPLLLYIVGIKDPHIAIGTSAIAVGATALINVVQLYRKGNVRLKDGIMFAIPGAIGSLIGSQLGLLTPANGLLVMFAFLMVIVAMKMLMGKNRIRISKSDRSFDVKKAEEIGNKATHNDTQRNMTVAVTTPEKRQQQWRLTLTGLGVGLAAGYFGIGGGFLIVPALMYAGGLAISTAIGTSLVAVSSFGFMTAFRYSFEGLVNGPAALILIAGGIGGSILGSKIGEKLDKRTLTKIFGIMLIVVAAYMIVKSLGIL